MSEMRVIDMTGDAKVIWDRTNQDEVDAARETFNRLKKKGHMAYSVRKDGEKGLLIHEFDPDSEKIILAPRMVGG